MNLKLLSKMWFINMIVFHFWRWAPHRVKVWCFQNDPLMEEVVSARKEKR